MLHAPTLANNLCDLCQEPLGRYHAYLLHQPDMVLSQLADATPAHLGCIEFAVENPDTMGIEKLQEGAWKILGIATVKTSHEGPSGRLVSILNDAGAKEARIHVFTPDTLRFLHLSVSAGHVVTRSATPDELIAWLQPALLRALTLARSEDEQREVYRQLGLIQSKLSAADRAAFQSHLK